ncbi:MAG: hypothetical protein LBF58_05630 [Deltaproteobacteria bacterium]|jgi:tetratricopeptide (TPR) repeat protein|nr:hypothetical protein [Deltaproteobacteria bacterium]
MANAPDEGRPRPPDETAGGPRVADPRALSAAPDETGAPTQAPAEQPPTGLKGRLSALGQKKFLSKIGPAGWDPARRAAVALILAALIVAGAVVASFNLLGPDDEVLAQYGAAYDAALDGAWNWVDGSEAAPIFTKPPWLIDLADDDGDGAILAKGVAAFLDFRYEDALGEFEELLDPASPDPRVLSLVAATNLRLLNYGEANSNYSKALAGTAPEKGGLKEASDRLGLSLALFHQQDYEKALTEAGISFRLRQKLLGPADSKTLAAVNSMATALMALSRSAVAGDLLLDAIYQAIEAGADQTQPVMRDSVSILYLAFEAQGRIDELQAFFAPPEPPPPADVAPAGGPKPDAPKPPETPAPEAAAQAGPQAGPMAEPEPPAPEPEPEAAPVATPLDRDGARALVDNLRANHPGSRVLPALALALATDLTGGAQTPCLGPYPAEAFDELLGLCLDVAKGYASMGEARDAADVLSGLTTEAARVLESKGEVNKPRVIEALALLATLLTERKDTQGAETALREARDIAATMPKDDRQTLTSLIVLSLRLSDLSLSGEGPPIEAEMELVSGLTAIKKIYANKVLESHPLTPVLYLRLAWLVASMGRSKDAGTYRTQAERSLNAVAKAHPEYQAAVDRIAQAQTLIRQGKADGDTLAYLWRAVPPANRPAQPPANPELMRVELSALKLLNRLPEFAAIIDPAIAWAAETHGPDSPAHRRYQSLNLKYLEESGDIPSLLAALDRLSAEPGTAKEPDRTAIMTSALRYKARVLESAGQKADAVEALSQARVKILDTRNLLDRLPEIEAEISRLSAPAPGR